MRGGVAISVTATPAAAPRRSREVLRSIIREPSGLRLRPTMGLDPRGPRPSGTPNRVWVGLHRPPRAVPMPERLHYLYLRSFSRRKQRPCRTSYCYQVPRGHLFWRVILQARHKSIETRLAG